MENLQLASAPVLRYFKEIIDAAVIETGCSDLPLFANHQIGSRPHHRMPAEIGITDVSTSLV